MWDSANQALRLATERVVLAVAEFLPGLIALLLAVLIAAIVAKVLGSLLKRSLTGIDFDNRIDQWGFSGLSDVSPSKSPTLLVSKAVSWAILLLGLMIGLTAFQANLTSRLVYSLFEYLPNVIAALMIIVVGTFAARFLARGVLISAVNMNIQSARLLSLGVKWLVLVLTTAMALDHLKIGGAIVHLAFAILFGGIVLALALAVGLGSKDMVSRSLERQATEQDRETEETFRHI
jgi:hypothetical protein